MNFIFAWLISSIAVFVLEMILMVGGKKILSILSFETNENLSFSRIRNMLLYSAIVGMALTLL